MQSFPQEELDREILLNYRALYACYERDKKRIPEGQLFEVRFEELEEAPLDIVELLYDRLSLDGFRHAKPAMERHLAAQKGFRKKKYRFDPETIRTIEQHWGDAVKQWNYHP